MGLRVLERLTTGLGHIDAEAASFEVRSEGPYDRGLVVDDEDARAGDAHVRAAACRGSSRSGSVNRNAAPPATRFSARMRPPCASTSPRATARPSPVPCDGRR